MWQYAFGVILLLAVLVSRMCAWFYFEKPISLCMRPSVQLY